MPELPEVEVIARGLRDKLIGLKLEELQILRPQILERTTPNELHQCLLGQAIARIERRGKYILFDFDNGCTLTTHLRMSGSYLVFDTLQSLSPYTRLCFNFSQHKQLQYQDKRALGKIRLYRPGEKLAELEALGVEPLGDEFSLDYLIQQLKRHKRELKPLLMDQKIIAGIGNIYASEILFAARITPLRRSNELNLAETELLHQAICQILTQAIASQGTHISDYVDPAGNRGNFGDLLTVYGRKGDQCLRCGGSILRIVQQQRSSYYCPKCQG